MQRGQLGRGSADLTRTLSVSHSCIAGRSRPPLASMQFCFPRTWWVPAQMAHRQCLQHCQRVPRLPRLHALNIYTIYRCHVRPGHCSSLTLQPEGKARRSQQCTLWNCLIMHTSEGSTAVITGTGDFIPPQALKARWRILMSSPKSQALLCSLRRLLWRSTPADKEHRQQLGRGVSWRPAEGAHHTPCAGSDR